MNILDSLFSWFAVATVRGSLLALAVLAIQAALRGRMPSRWRYALWLPVVFVLVTPHLPQSRWSVENRFASRIIPVQQTASLSAPDIALQGRPIFDELPTTMTQPPPPLPDWRRVAGATWLGGTAGLLVFALAGYVRTMQRMRRGTVPADATLVTMLSETALATGLRRPPRLLVSTVVQSPAVTGLVRPLLLLPADFPGAFTREEARLIVLHELMHLKRHDLPMNWLLCLLQAIHWCNPVLWFAFARMRADREAACDSQVLAMTAEDRRASYGRALLKLQGGLAHTGLNLAVLGIFERAAGMRTRIRAIAAYRRAHPAWGVLAGVLIAALTLAGATRAQDRGVHSAPGKSQRAGADIQTRPGTADHWYKLNTIIIPRLEFRDATIQEALAFIKKKSAELDVAEPDPANRGVNIVLNLDAPSGSAPRSPVPARSPAADPRKARITISLANTPLLEALTYVTSLADLRFRVVPHAVEIQPMSVPTDMLVTKEWVVSPELGLKPGMNPREFLIVCGLYFPDGASAVLSPDGTRLVLRNTPENLHLADALFAASSDPPGAIESSAAVNRRSGTESMLRKLNTLIIPRLEFRDATIREALDFLKQKSVELDTTEPDPARRGVNIVRKLGAAAVLDDARLTISLTNIPLLEALKYVASLANLKFTVDEYAVSLVPLSVSTDVLETQQWKLDEAMLPALGLGAGIEAKDALSAKGVAFPPGATATWIPRSQRLILRNTRENLDRVHYLFENLFEKRVPPPSESGSSPPLPPSGSPP